MTRRDSFEAGSKSSRFNVKRNFSALEIYISQHKNGRMTTAFNMEKRNFLAAINLKDWLLQNVVKELVLKCRTKTRIWIKDLFNQVADQFLNFVENKLHICWPRQWLAQRFAPLLLTAIRTDFRARTSSSCLSIRPTAPPDHENPGTSSNLPITLRTSHAVDYNSALILQGRAAG